MVIDWKTIRTNKDYGRLFNDKLHISLMEHGIHESTDGQEYTTFNYLILQAASETATKLKYENKGCLNQFLETFLPVITN